MVCSEVLLHVLMSCHAEKLRKAYLTLKP